MINTTSPKTALIFGASGLIGGHLLDIFLESPDYGKVITFGRSKMEKVHEKLTQELVDFDQPDSFAHLVKGDELFCCLGTTRAKAGKEGFYKVDFTYCLNAAEAGRKNGVQQFALISSMGADADSMFYYSKVKGEIENAVKELGFPTTHILRPSLLLGERAENRLGEAIAQKVMGGIDKVAGNILGKYGPIEAEAVAQAMVNAVKNKVTGVQVYDSQMLENMALVEAETSQLDANSI